MGIFSELFRKDASENESVPVKKENNTTVIDTSLGKVSVSVQHNEPEIPPLQGDYAKAVFLWAFSRPSPIHKADDYAAYFLYECGIRDCVKYHQNMISEGYLIEAEPCEVLNAFKLLELKEMLKELNQPVSGKKAALIDRILETTDDDFLRAYCPQKLYKPSA